jgi:hypothetical protein
MKETHWLVNCGNSLIAPGEFRKSAAARRRRLSWPQESQHPVRSSTQPRLVDASDSEKGGRPLASLRELFQGATGQLHCVRWWQP